MKSVCLVVQAVYDFDIRVRRKAEALVSRGYIVDVLALRPQGSEENYTLNGVNVHSIGLGKERGSLARYAFEYVAFFLWALVQVTLRMRRRSYAVVDFNTLPDFLVFAGILARLQGAKLVLDMHEITPEFYMSKYGSSETSWLIRILKFIERASFNFADHVLTINDPVEDLFVSRGLDRSKSTILMNSADESRFLRTPAGKVNVEGGDTAQFVMMYHGTLTPLYGLDIAIEAMALAHEQMPGAELWILGSGTEKKALSELAEARGLTGKVRLLGHVSPSEIPAWLNRCDAGILPIRRDVFLDFAFPNKLPELIIAGKPVIISRLKAIRSYFSENALSYFEPNRPADLARQMIRMYEDRPLRSRLVARAKEEYAPIRWEVMKERYLNLMDRLTGAPRQEIQELDSSPANSLR